MAIKDTKINYPTAIDENGNITYGSYKVNGRDNAQQAQTTQATNAANLYLAWQENQWNVAQWNRENEYNSPLAKLQRLAEAGLNPVFYGLDGVSNSNQLTSASLANQTAPTLANTQTQRAAEISSALSSLSGGVKSSIETLLAPKQLALANRKADAEIDKAGAESAKVRQETENLKADYGMKPDQARLLKNQADEMGAKVQVAQAQYNDLVAQIGERAAHKQLMETQNEYLKKEGDARIQKIKSDLNLNSKQAEEIDSRIAKYAQDVVLGKISSEGLQIDNYSKWIEAQYKDMNMQQQYNQNNADIIQKSYGFLTPVMNILMSGTGSVSQKDHANALSNGYDPSADHFPEHPKKSTDIPKPSWTKVGN